MSFCSSRLETAVSLAPKDDEEKAKTKEAVAKTHEKSGHVKRRGRKRHSHRRARRSVSSKAVPHTHIFIKDVSVLRSETLQCKECIRRSRKEPICRVSEGEIAALRCF